MLEIMSAPIVQIYEIQTPEEARAMIDAGVDHIGSVILSRAQRRDPALRDTISLVRRYGAVSSLIPLFTDPDAVLAALDYLRPQIVHFCDRLSPAEEGPLRSAYTLQEAVKRGFPDVRVMRSIPIGQTGGADAQAVLALAARLEPVSDYFLTDTVMAGTSGSSDADQPVDGFVGITGLTCDWSVAAQLVARSRIPVILAGGISPENVADGIKRVRPFGVDSCTCTNAVDGRGRPIRFKKDVQRVRALIAQVRKASA
ncbi:MAG TPA: phosphoribosylanthranilate isomerase [Desulfosarcina sp.]|nr:phosphoribosylanthranilate isomerase [Desulfosarcina sp.]